MTNPKKEVLPWHSPQFQQEARALAASRVRFEQHEGARILILDYSQADFEMVRAVSAECLRVMSAEPSFSVLSLCNVEDIVFDLESLRIGGELSERTRPYSARTAVWGITGFRAFLLQTVADAAGRPMKLFKDRAAAFDWLLSQGPGDKPAER